MKEIKVGMVSLGCPKNQCDAELMMRKIHDAGYRLVSEPGLADVVIINTCGFIQSAKEEAIEEIMEAVNRKNDNINKKIIVTGCLAQRYTKLMDEEFPEVDAVLGLGCNGGIVAAIEEVLKDKRVIKETAIGDYNIEGDRLMSTMPHYAYLRIADGCDNRCTYCAIPYIRGRFRSRPMENLVKEAEGLAEKGVKELILVAQDTTRYGLDLYKRLMLPELLNRLCEIEGVKWIRLLYCYPERVTDELIDVMASREKVIPYIDIPIQHCNRDILKAMNRQGDEQTLWDLFAKLRTRIPGLILRTTLITGFPGETEDQFVELAEFANNVKFEHLGCFPYSREDDTPAAKMENQIPESEKKHRAEIITEQQEIRAADFCEQQKGKVFETVVEGYDRYFEMYFGRNYMYAPEIDGMVYFKGKGLKTGQFVNVKITESMENNLIGETV
ncbi:MAG TPA: 30S ribosomal protein S12 methylthiotransferase RimO [Ruminococcaceae bacterium]|nr:30S ribosomal protein S12 methylthiotransferase RimO [Oscillospiraceae bacterium]